MQPDSSPRKDPANTNDASCSPYSREALAKITISDDARKKIEELADTYNVQKERLEGLFKTIYVFKDQMRQRGMKVDMSDELILKDIEIDLRQGPIGPRR